MTREEFSKQLRELRDENRVLVKNIAYALNVESTHIHRYEKAQHSYALSKAIGYIHAVNAELSLEHQDGTSDVVRAPEDAISLFKSLRKLSYRALGDAVGVTHNSLRKIEVGETALSIDIFLKLSEYYNLKVILRKKP